MDKKLRRYEIIGNEIKRSGWTFGAEIGVWGGATFFELLDRFPKLTLIGVDQWKVYDGIGNKFTTGYADYSVKKDLLLKYRKEVPLRASRYGCRATILTMSSLNAAELIGDGLLDFVFIDADHRNSYVRADLAAWTPKVKVGGKIFGHDFNMPSVREAVEGFSEKVTSYRYDNVWMIQK